MSEAAKGTYKKSAMVTTKFRAWFASLDSYLMQAEHQIETMTDLIVRPDRNLLPCPIPSSRHIYQIHSQLDQLTHQISVLLWSPLQPLSTVALFRCFGPVRRTDAVEERLLGIPGLTDTLDDAERPGNTVGEGTAVGVCAGVGERRAECV